MTDFADVVVIRDPQTDSYRLHAYGQSFSVSRELLEDFVPEANPAAPRDSDEAEALEILEILGETAEERERRLRDEYMNSLLREIRECARKSKDMLLQRFRRGTS